MKLYYFIILILYAFCEHLSGKQLPIQTHPYYFKQISINEGLSSTVRCIRNDASGFVWIGTKSGLVRFDGHELKHYIHMPDNPNSLPNNLVIQIMEDKQLNLWILTGNGVARYNRKNDNFEIITDKQGQPIIAYSVYNSPNGVLFGGENKIYRYNSQTSSIDLLHSIKFKTNFIISAMNFWDSKTLLCSSRRQGLTLLNLQTGICTPPPFDCGSEIMSTLIDSQHRIWIAPYNEGVRCFNRNGQLLASFTVQNSQLSNNIILCFAERNSQIWMGTDGGGINILNPKTKQITLLTRNPEKDRNSLPATSILCLYNDIHNQMWAGSIRNGLINIREVSMKTYTDVIPGSDQGLSNRTVLTLCQQAADRIWIGTDGGGINLFNPKTERFAHYPSTWGDKVASIVPFTPGKLLISIFAQGIFVFDPITGKKQPFLIVDKKTTSQLCKRGTTVNLYRNTPNSVLFLGEDIYNYRLDDHSFHIFHKEKGNKGMRGAVLPIVHEKGKTYLSCANSIHELNDDSHQMKCLFRYEKDTIINCVSRDEQGNFWIGSNLGLSYYNPITHAHEFIPSKLFSEVSLVVCDLKGKVWIGAENMLLTWIIKDKRLVLFGESDGAIPNEYLSKPQLLTDCGNIYMGGVGGLLYIDKHINFNSSDIPVLQLSDITVNGEPANNQLSSHIPAKISIAWKSNITLRIMPKEQDIFRKKIYRYKIAGFSNEYIETLSPKLVLRLLPPGNYTIKATCTTKDGNWIPEQEILSLIILPPWYRTWWFISVCIALIAGSIFQTFRIALQRKENKQKWAMKEYEKQVYEEKVRFLINISHELRTPLSLIYAPLSKILKSISPTDHNYVSLQAVFRQSQRMKNLINMVLDVRKMEVGESKLQITSYPLNKWIQEATEDFISEGESKDIRLQYQLDEKIGEVSFDKEKCTIIISNLLINAFKHSPKFSEVTIQSELSENKEKVRISIIDQGCGLLHVDTHKLFERFYQGTGEQSGTGIGLSYSKMLIELHGGSIGARNNQSAGATFYFELPLRQENENIICQPRAYLNELMAKEIEIISTTDDTFDTSSYSILVVDDNPDLIDFLKQTLSTNFKSILTAKDGVDALLQIKNHMPDIIISDVMMPRMNGYELCKNIKRDFTISHIPIILLTARDDEQSQLNGYKNGADAYLVKPFDTDMLLTLIRNRLKYREQTKERYKSIAFSPSPEESTFSSIDETFLLKLNKIINQNIENTDLDISFICREIGMSRAALYSKLKAITNMGANDYINKMKIEKAISIMKSSDLTFTEIAEKIGFSTPRYFSTVFKLHTGETPTNYREKLERNK